MLAKLDSIIPRNKIKNSTFFFLRHFLVISIILVIFGHFGHFGHFLIFLKIFYIYSHQAKCNQNIDAAMHNFLYFTITLKINKNKYVNLF